MFTFCNIFKHIFKHDIIQPMNIIIMAGGEGKRMQSSIPKVLHLFKGRPMLLCIVDAVTRLKPSCIIIVTGKHVKRIQDTCRAGLDANTMLKLHFVNQPEPLGTGNAILHTLPHLEKSPMTLILNGDTPALNSTFLNQTITEIDDICSRKQIPTNKRNFIISCILERPFGYGRIITSRKNKFDTEQIKYIIEEKDASSIEKSIKTVNTGIYFVNTSSLLSYIPIISNDNASREYYLTDIVSIALEKSESFYTYTIPSQFNHIVKGVNTRDQLEDLENEKQ